MLVSGIVKSVALTRAGSKVTMFDSESATRLSEVPRIRNVSTEGVRAELTPDIVRSFGVAQVVRDHSKPVNSLDFHRSGELLASSGSDETILFMHPLAGSVKKVLPVKKYGCGTIRFTYGTGVPSLLTATCKTGADDAVRALDVSACEYLRYYSGHSGRVVGLAPSPTDPTSFLSSSLDLSVALWDSRRRDAVGQVKTHGTPAVAFDPKGLVFGVAYLDAVGTQVKLYDARSYEEGPFVEFCVEGDADPTCFEFSPDGENFLLASGKVGNPVRLFDAYEGKLRRSFKRPEARKTVTMCARFSPDAKFVMTGGEDHGVCIWDIATSENLLDPSDKHVLPVSSCAWNPVYGTAASACQNVALWLPKADKVLSAS